MCMNWILSSFYSLVTNDLITINSGFWKLRGVGTPVFFGQYFKSVATFVHAYNMVAGTPDFKSVVL